MLTTKAHYSIAYRSYKKNPCFVNSWHEQDKALRES